MYNRQGKFLERKLIVKCQFCIGLSRDKNCQNGRFCWEAMKLWKTLDKIEQKEPASPWSPDDISRRVDFLLA